MYRAQYKSTEMYNRKDSKKRLNIYLFGLFFYTQVQD